MATKLRKQLFFLSTPWCFLTLNKCLLCLNLTRAQKSSHLFWWWGLYSFYEDLEKLVDFPVSSQPDDEESRKQSENANQRRFCWNFLVLRLPKLCFLQSSATFLPGRPRKQALHHLLIRPMCLSHAQTTTHWWKDIQSNLEDALFHFLPWRWASCFFCRGLEGVFLLRLTLRSPGEIHQVVEDDFGVLSEFQWSYRNVKRRFKESRWWVREESAEWLRTSWTFLYLLTWWSKRDAASESRSYRSCAWTHRCQTCRHIYITSADWRISRKTCLVSLPL